MNATAREFNQNSSRILADAENGKTITITKSGRPVAVLRPYQAADVSPYPDAPLADVDLPALDLPALSDDEIDETLRGMGA